MIEDVPGLDDGFIRSLGDLRAAGAAALGSSTGQLDELVKEVTASDLATLVYTSGTTGPPKGTMITHANVMATMRSLTSLIEIGPDDRFLSFLPLSHITERSISHFGQIVSGAETWFARSIATIAEDLQACRPTLLFAVPRVWEKFKDGVLEHIGGQRGVARHLADRYLTVAAARAAGGGIAPSVEFHVLDRRRREHHPPPARPRPRSHRRLRRGTGPPRSAALVPRHRPAHRRGLRADRGLAVHEHEPPRDHSRRHRRPADPGRRR